jgi:ABC-type dipeptide/oligopeptide/nickel transport system permease component
MLIYTAQRIVQSLGVLLIASIPIFLILRAAPGDPAQMLAGTDATPQDVQNIREALGLDKPMAAQYFIWISHTVQGDLGKSMFVPGMPVRRLLTEKFWPTAELAVVAQIMAVLIAVPLGVMAALRRGRILDHTAISFSTLSIAIPNFWLGIMLILLFSQMLGWLPAGGRTTTLLADPFTALRFMFLPALTLALYTAAILMRFVRVSMIEVLHQDYVRTAHAKGLPRPRVIYRHALQNALLPFLTVLGAQFGRLLAGALIVELIFAWPGMGQLVLGAIKNRDYPLVQGCLMVFVVFVVVSNLVTDLLYGVVDPRISVGSGGRR